MLLGCIADDFTGATDLAGMLVKSGMRTMQAIGVPAAPPPPGLDAIVVALKTRTCPPAEAIDRSLAALAWLREAGCRQFYFKYCSTFDSTPQGNIGPVADALMDALGTGFTIACPAFPANGRTIYKGHLFVGDTLLSDSGMRDHPLTPMTDSNLVRVLQRQARRKVGLVEHATVRAGAAGIARRFEELQASGHGYAIVDAITDADLHEIAHAVREMPLVTAGSGLAQGLPANFGIRSDGAASAAFRAASGGRAAVVSGSCSLATNEQVRVFEAARPAFRVSPLEIAAGTDVVAQALAWASKHLAVGPVLVHATAPAQEVRAAQAALGVENAGAIVERALSEIAAGFVALGVDKLVVAGGETSGAVVQRLGIDALLVGPEIDPGVPWMLASGSDPPLYLALKSGNFGAPDFFVKAWDKLGWRP